MRKASILPHAHRVVKKRQDGGVTIYWYRHRGSGSSFASFRGKHLREAEALEARSHGELVRAYEASATPSVGAIASVADLVKLYKTDPEGLPSLAPSTQRQWRPQLDLIVRELGDMPVKALGAPGARSALYRWRDRRAQTPRAADYAMQVLKRVLSLSKEKGRIHENPAAGIKNLFKAGQRANIIVLAHELDAILAACTDRAQYPISLLAETGLRRGDVASLKWEEVHDTYLLLITNKSRGRQSAFVPLTPKAREVLSILRAERDAIIARGEVPSAFVCTTDKGTRWKDDSITQAFNRARDPLGINKHLNDLRGTAATRLKVAGMSNEEIADQLGWAEERVRKIIQHYVDPHLVAQQRLERLQIVQATGS